MEITVNNTRFNITSEDLEDADVEFSFWEGRRFIFYGKDVKEHFLRYNDIVKGVLAEDESFIEVDDKQKLYAALNKLKDKGYPYKGSWATTMMLYFKQLFGNFSRQQLLDQLETKLNAENVELSPDEELSTSEEPNSEALISPICNYNYVDVLPLVFKYAGRTACFPLMFTCKLFQRIITVDKHLNYLRDFGLLKQIFEECQHCNFNFNTIIDLESKCILLLAEFLPKEANRITPSKPNRRYEQNEAYIKHQQKLATLLAKTDPKSALKVVAAIDKESYPVQTFCAVAAIHKNSTLCDEKQVLAMGDIAYADPSAIRYFSGSFNRPSGLHAYSFCNMSYCITLMELFEASLGVHSPLANKTLELLGKYPVAYVQYLAKMVKRIGVDQLKKSEFWEIIVGLLNKPLELNSNRLNMTQSLAILAKTLVIFDKEKANQALELALNSVTELKGHLKVNALIEIAEVFTDFDQDRAFELAKLALTKAEVLYVLIPELREEYRESRLRLFDSMGRIIKIFAKNNTKFALQALGEIADKIRIMDENFLSHYYKIFPDEKMNDNFSFDQFPNKLFMGAIELYASFDPKLALEMANLGVEWAKTRAIRMDEMPLLKLSQILLKSFPDKALEVANMIQTPETKCQALISIVSQGSDYSEF